MKTVFLTGMLLFCTSKSFAMNAMEAFQQADEESRLTLTQRAEESKSNQIRSYVVRELRQFQVDASERLEEIIVDYEWVASSRENDPSPEYFQYFTAYAWGRWTVDGREAQGTCQLRAGFSVPQGEARMTTVEEEGRTVLRIQILSPSTQLRMREVEQRPTCHEI